MMNRPKIQVPKTSLDHILEALPFILIVVEFYFIIHYYPELPDKMPQHFDGSGQPDAYGNKSILWFPPIINLILVAGMIYLTRFPHILNYLTEITEENAAIQYKLAQRMLRLLASLIAALFLYITVSTIYTGIGQWNGTGMWFMPVFILAIMGTLIPYLILSSKNA
jgi:uncharacterized membrane protein